MKFLKFSNRAENVSRIGLEKLGYSTKRNDPTTIGQFGSGIKFAPIAAMRNGWRWYFTGTDANGDYILQYVKKMEDGIECIFYDYNHGEYVKPSSFTVDAGVLSWDSAFQIYREAFANTIDAAKSSEDWYISLVDESEIVVEDGWFSCYIEAAPELMEIDKNQTKYFTINREPLFSYYGGYGEKSEDRKAQIFHTIDDTVRIYSYGVLVSTYDEVDLEPIYNYNFNGLALNEERTIKNQWEVDAGIARVLANCNDKSLIEVFLMKTVGETDDTKIYEVSPTGVNEQNWQYMYFDVAWHEVFKKLFMRDDREVIIYDQIGFERGAKDFITLRGFAPLFIANKVVYAILQRIGVKTFLEIADESVMFDIDYDTSAFPLLEKAIAIVARYEPSIAEMHDSGRLGVLMKETGNLGLTLNINKPVNERIILIDKTHIETNDLEAVVATLIHEIDHVLSGIADGNQVGRMFRNLADERLSKLMVKYYDDSAVSIEDGMLRFPMSKWAAKRDFKAKFTIERLATFDKALVTVSDKAFMVNSDIDFSNLSWSDMVEGFLSISGDGEAFTISGLTNVKEVESV